MPVVNGLTHSYLLDTNELLTGKTVILSSDTSVLKSGQESLNNPNFRNPDVKNLFPRLEYYSSEHLTVSPLRFMFNNGFEGGDLVGVNNHFRFTDFLSGHLNFTFSSSFYGPFYPQRYNNGSVSLDLTWQLHERVRLNTFGQLSLREGIDPKFAPVINGGNYYGGEIQIKLIKNLGVGFGFTNSYYRNNWTFTPFTRPVTW